MRVRYARRFSPDEVLWNGTKLSIRANGLMSAAFAICHLHKLGPCSITWLSICRRNHTSVSFAAWDSLKSAFYQTNLIVANL